MASIYEQEPLPSQITVLFEDEQPSDSLVVAAQRPMLERLRRDRGRVLKVGRSVAGVRQGDEILFRPRSVHFMSWTDATTGETHTGAVANLSDCLGVLQ